MVYSHLNPFGAWLKKLRALVLSGQSLTKPKPLIKRYKSSALAAEI
jgi:hypothetical protein